MGSGFLSTRATAGADWPIRRPDGADRVLGAEDWRIGTAWPYLFAKPTPVTSRMEPAAVVNF